MKPKRKVLTDEEIDSAVIGQTEDDSCWEKPVKVLKSKSTSLALPSALAARAAFFARLHREANLEEWIKRIVEERVDIEEAVFAGSKRELVGKRIR